MQLACEVCHAPLDPDDVRMDLAVARCQSCNALYDLSGRKGRGRSSQAPEKPRRVRAQAPLPSHFKIEESDGVTRIRWRWFNFVHVLMLVFCICWDGALVMGFNSGLRVSSFILIHVTVGVLLTYCTLAGWVNQTAVEVSRNRLTVRHGPLPWPGNRDVPGRQLTQLYGEEIVKTNKGSKSYSYDLMALDREGRKIKLLKGLLEKEQVLYLEQTLERRLGIEDAPVDGEFFVRNPAV